MSAGMLHPSLLGLTAGPNDPIHAKSQAPSRNGTVNPKPDAKKLCPDSDAILIYKAEIPTVSCQPPQPRDPSKSQTPRITSVAFGPRWDGTRGS